MKFESKLKQPQHKFLTDLQVCMSGKGGGETLYIIELPLTRYKPGEI